MIKAAKLSAFAGILLLAGLLGWSIWAPAQTVIIPPPLVQVASATTSGGNWTVNWATTFNSPSPYVHAEPVNTAGTPIYICNTVTTTPTQATGNCSAVASSVSLPTVATSLLGYVVTIITSAPTMSLRVVGRDTTQ